MREKLISAAWTVGIFLWKTAWIFLVFIFGWALYVTGKNAGTAEAILFQQNIGMSVCSTAVVMLMLYWWQMDSTGDMQNDLKELKKQNKALEDKLTLTNILLQQFVDKANQPTPNTLPPQTNPAANPASPNQTVVTSNGHVNNGN